MILTITLNPSVDRTLFVESLKPRDTNRVIRTETDAGGKGVNLARVARELDGRAFATGFLGGPAGKLVRQTLEAEGVEHAFVEVEGETRLNITVEDRQGPPTSFNEPGPTISLQDWSALSDFLENLYPAATYVAMGGSLPPGVPADAYLILQRAAREYGCLSVVDADGYALQNAMREPPFLVKPNGAEAGRYLRRDIQTMEDALDAAREFVSRGVEIAIVSMGADGAALASASEEMLARPPRVEAVSTIGSGDSLVAGFLVGLEQGMSLAESLRLGVAAGAATAMTNGSEIGRRETILSLISEVQIESMDA